MASKAYAMTGWRIGYAGAPEQSDQGHEIWCRGSRHRAHASIAQWAGVEALNGPRGFHFRSLSLAKRLKSAAISLSSTLNQAEIVSCPMPKVIARVSEACKDAIGKRTRSGKRSARLDEELRHRISKAEGVAAVHGSAASGLGPNFRNISYA